MRLSLFDVQIRALYLCGILPPKSVYCTPWKRKLFNIYTTLALFSYLPVFVTQFMVLYEFLDNIDMAVTIIFQMWVFTYTGIIAYYFTCKRSQILSIFEKLETSFLPYLKKIGTPETNSAITIQAHRKSNILTWTTMILCWMVVFAWECFPYIMRYFDLLNGNILLEENDMADKWRYFCIITWLPQQANLSPIYDLIYAFEAFAGYVTVASFTACNMVFYSLIFHVTTHFKVLTAAIEDTDKIIFNYNISIEETPEITTGNVISEENRFREGFNDDLKHTTKRKIFEINALSDRKATRKGQNSSVDTSETPVRITSDTPRDEVTLSSQNSSLPVTSDDWTLKTAREAKMYRYFVDCVSYHQKIIEFCKEVNELLSPALLVFFISSQALLCLPAFLLALGLSDTLLKLFTAVIDAFVWPVIVCFYGDRLSEQSLSVQQAAYSCRWYDHSTRIKKLLQIVIMRAQRPVRFTAGKFYVVSLETLAEIVNKVYAYFTVLKQAHES